METCVVIIEASSDYESPVAPLLRSPGTRVTASSSESSEITKMQLSINGILCILHNYMHRINIWEVMQLQVQFLKVN